MHYFNLPLFLTFIFMQSLSVGASYDFLKKFEQKPTQWTREIPPIPLKSVDRSGVRGSLQNFYDEFAEQGKIRIYMGLGYEAYKNGAQNTFLNMLQAASNQMQLGLKKLRLNGTTITFEDTREILYELTIGNERNEFKESFKDYQVVMYHGHSRYGRGPAFETFTNYFRMGDVFPTIEVDTRNPYFLNERILNQNEFPLQSVELGGKQYIYQYRGEKDHSSYLPQDAYTKVIEGNDKDLKATKYLDGRQIFWFYSCSNIDYWRNTLRSLFPNTDEKFIFGTKIEGYWSYSPAIVMITSVIKQVADSQRIVQELNQTNDCGPDCFVTY